MRALRMHYSEIDRHNANAAHDSGSSPRMLVALECGAAAAAARAHPASGAPVSDGAALVCIFPALRPPGQPPRCRYEQAHSPKPRLLESARRSEPSHTRGRKEGRKTEAREEEAGQSEGHACIDPLSVCTVLRPLCSPLFRPVPRCLLAPCSLDATGVHHRGCGGTSEPHSISAHAPFVSPHIFFLHPHGVRCCRCRRCASARRSQ
jgi:hypothetical protein